MAMERQNSWGKLVALYMFLGGTGAGIYTASFILNITGGIKQLAVTGMVLGPIAVIIGLLCLLVEAGSPLQSVRLFRGLPTSWMSRGSLIQILFILFGLVSALPGFWSSEWMSSGIAITLGSIALFLALALAAYHGAAMTESKRIPLWSSSVMPLLSFFTALCTGLGLLLLVSIAFDGTEVIKTVSLLAPIGAGFVVGELIAVWSLMGASPNETYTESVKRIKTPMVAATICLLLSLVLLGLVIAASNVFSYAFPISGVLLLVAGFIVRYSVLRGGYYIPLRVPGTIFQFSV